MSDREGLSPADEKPANPAEEEEATLAESDSEETPIQPEPEETEAPAEEAPVPAVDELEDVGNPLDLALSDAEDLEEEEPEAEEEMEEVLPPEEVEAPEATEEAPAEEPEQKPHLYNLPDADWKSLSQDGRNEYLKVRKDAEKLRAQADAIDQFTAQLGLDDQEVLTAMQLTSALKTNPAMARELLAEHFPDAVTPPAAPAPTLSKDLVDELGAAVEDVDLDRLESVLEKLKTLATAPEAPAPTPPAVKQEAPPSQPTGENPDARIWNTLSAVSGLDLGQDLEQHAKVLGQRVVKRLGKVPDLADQEMELLREHRLLMDEQRKAAEAAKKTPSARPIRSRAPRSVPASSVAVEEPLDPLAIALGQ